MCNIICIAIGYVQNSSIKFTMLRSNSGYADDVMDGNRSQMPVKVKLRNLCFSTSYFYLNLLKNDRTLKMKVILCCQVQDRLSFG